jgi:chromosome segregation ATPase
MKNQKLLRIGIFFLALLFASATAYAGVFDNDEENWRRMFRDIKKINSRLVTLETGKMQALENTQRELFRQIDEIKSLMPNLQGAVEQSQAEERGRFEAINRKLADIENQIKQDIVQNVNQQLGKINQQVSLQLNQQTKANEKFQANLATQFDQLKGHLAGDMEKIANENQKFFQGLTQSNNQSFANIVDRLKSQEKTLDRYNGIIKSDLIPTIIQQNEKTGNQLLAGMSQANKENKETLLAGLANIGAKNQKLVEVLQMSLKEGEATRGNVERLSQNVDATNKNVLSIHNDIVKLKDALVQQIVSLSKAQQGLVAQVGSGSLQISQKVEGVHQNLMVAGEQINKLAESLKGVQTQTYSSAASLASLQQNVEQVRGENALNGEKINKLISSSTELATHSNAMNQSLQSVGQSLQNIEGGMVGVEASNQKLTKLIDILKVMAAEQGKLTQIIAGQGEIKQSQHQILTTQVELNKVQVEMSKAQAQMSNASKATSQLGQNQAQILQAQQTLKQAQDKVINTQAQILKAQERIINAQRQSLKDQADTKKTLSELSRKANVNISRNDAIRKTLSNIGKKPSPPPTR